MKYKYVLILVIASISCGYYLGRGPDSEHKIEYKERIVRQIVRVTNPDGSIKETINETENRSNKESLIVNNSRKYSIEALYAPLESDTYQVGLGYRLFKNVSIKASYVRHNSEHIGLIGAQVDF